MSLRSHFIRRSCKALLVLAGFPGCFSPNEPVATGAADASTQPSEETSGSSGNPTSSTVTDASNSETSATSPTSSTSSPGDTSDTSDSDSGSSDDAGTMCGNGALDPGENCDDGDRENADGCNNDCRESGQLLWELTASEGLLVQSEASGPLLGEAIAASADGGCAITIPLYPNGAAIRWIDVDGVLGWTSLLDVGQTTTFLADVAVAGDGSVAFAGFRGDMFGLNLQPLVGTFDGDGNPKWSDVLSLDEGGFFGAIAATDDDALVLHGGGVSEPRTLLQYGYLLDGTPLQSGTILDPDPETLALENALGPDGTVYASHWVDGHSQITRQAANGSIDWELELVDTTVTAVAARSSTLVAVGTSATNAAWLAKYDADGMELWSVEEPGEEGASFQAVVIDADSNIVAVGWTRYEAEVTDYRRWIRKMSPQGDLLWEHEFDDPAPGNAADYEVLAGVAVDGQDDIYVVGRRAVEAFADTTWVAKFSP